jgi:hypothetical protein
MSDRPFDIKAANILEALWNLTYLVCEEAENPERVRYYAHLSEERLQAMTTLLQHEHERS